MQPKTARAGIAMCLLLLSCIAMAQSPGSIPHSSLWLKGNLDGKPDHATLLNFNPATAFNEANTSLEIPHDITQLGQATVFTVYRDEAPNIEHTVWEMKGEFGDVLLSTESLSSASRNSKMTFSKQNVVPSQGGISSETIINTYTRRIGNQQKNRDEQADASLQFGHAIAADANTAFSGLIAEFILFESVLKVEEKDKLETYLALKYGITLEKDYRNSSGNIVWETESPFSNNVVGIARDDNSTLYQKQATSSHEASQLVIGADKIVLSNNKNTATLNNGDYLVWGDNGDVFSLPDASENPLTISGKKWRMKTTGATANTIATQLKIDIKTLLSDTFDKAAFGLVIDRSGTGLFAVETLDFILPENISPEGIATFNNVLWDTDSSGADIFSFGLKPENELAHQPIALPEFTIENTTEIKAAPSSVLSFREFPNPTLDGSYNLNITLAQPADIEIRVFDMHQRLLHTQTGAGRSAYQFSGFINGAPGVYTIMLVTSEEEISRKIIVE